MYITLQGDEVPGMLEAHNSNQNPGECGANQRSNDRNSGILPIRFAFTGNRKNRVGDSRAQIASRIDGIPVVPPSERPIAQTRHPTRYGPRPAAGPSFATALAKIAPAMNTRTKVPMISLM